MAGFLAGVTAAVHFAALLYIGLGGFLAWRWPRSIFVHVFFAAWGFLVLALPLPCPLTVAEDHLRGLQGLGPLPGGFNEYYIYDVIVPRELLPVAGVVAVGVLAVSYVGAYQRWRSRQDQDVPRRRVRAC
ncbi:Protein of Unknown function [Amycolatopsis arida]|uniref:DUF2784 domain-containing protein n=1 Tax=Amycolatopsis arida TaxID=587909 RepID=A0A1I5T740_9PSEU|nr:DUF2784 domain-containing protein [Amycolatopsis arida]TDX96211.1 uncharacterized protein DUF2784 [Amycolatopsis arida]SFP78641.1 Protein of Unknown function [Amycolatopsis arida]